MTVDWFVIEYVMPENWAVLPAAASAAAMSAPARLTWWLVTVSSS